jgi:predicted enzyme related to lactoylglutathione lyase
MGERTSHAPGTFSWVELATTDPDTAKSFYGELFGWDAQDNEIPGGGGTYTMALIRGNAVAGIAAQPEQQRSAGVPPNWFSYVAVAGADEAAERAKEVGGQVHAGPFDVGKAGRMAVIGDPSGAMLGVWQAGDAPGAARVNEPGCFSWNELVTNDPDVARDFYSGLFGWSFEEASTDGGGPRYWIIGHDGAAAGQNGGVREPGPQEERLAPYWVPYFATVSADSSVARAEELGGAILIPVTEIPAGRFAGVRDPQGAVFYLFEGHLDD